MAKIFYPQARVAITVTIDDFTNTAPKDKYRQTMWLVPDTVEVVKNPSIQADSFTITFSAEDLPILPSQIIGGQAEVYLFQTDGFDANNTSFSRQYVAPVPPPPPGVVMDINEIRDSGNWPIIVGTFDDVSTEYSESGRTVSISGQDYTAYLLAIQWPPTAKGGPRRVKPGPRLDRWVQAMLDEADPDLKLRVALSGAKESEIPDVGHGLKVKRNGIAIDQNTKYWDVISKVCKLHGYTVYMDGTFAVLQLRKGPADGTPPKTFRMGWKDNISALRANRKLGKEKAPQVIVYGYNPNTKEQIYGEWPTGAEVARRAKKRDKDQDIVVKNTPATTKSGKSVKPRTKTDKSTQEYIVLHAESPVTDVRRLIDMARNEYELKSRGQSKLTIQTNDLRDSRKQDLLKVKSGDIMFVHFDPFDLDTLAGMEGKGTAAEPVEQQRFDYLINKGYSFDMADFLSTQYNLVDQLRRPFIVSEASFSYASDSGIDIEFQLQEAINAGPSVDGKSREEKRADKFPDLPANPRKDNPNLLDLE